MNTYLVLTYLFILFEHIVQLMSFEICASMCVGMYGLVRMVL